MGHVKLAHFSPGRILFALVFLTIAVGTLALALPICRTQPISFLDLIFTATSVTCATGLFTVPLSAFSDLGHAVILVLSQIGGIGLVTLTMFMLSLFVELGLSTQLIAGQLLQLESWKNIRSFMLFIILLTMSVELVGAACFFFVFIHDFSFGKALFLSLFHAVASFCNTGISIFPEGIDHYRTHNLILLITTALMIFGGLGFVTWNEIVRSVQAIMNRKRYAFSLHSKIVFYSTAILLGLGLFFLLCFEWHNTISITLTNIPHVLTQSLFDVASFRGAGFVTQNFHAFGMATVILIMLLAFVGGAPGGTSGGIKVTTLTLFLGTIRAAITNRSAVEIQARRIAKDQVYRAVAVTALSTFWIIFITIMLLISDTRHGFFALFFEATSAFCNLGLSFGITNALSAIGKMLLMVSMVIGRIGSLTFVLALKARHYPEIGTFSYPEERVILS